jgi:uncharacterized lipoprotein YmbA
MKTIAFLSIALLFACAGASPPPTQYLLRVEPKQLAARVETPVRVGLGRVVVAPYLEQAGVVVETEAGEVRAARQHQWAEPLDVGLRSYLRSEISAALGYDVSSNRIDESIWDYAVSVYVDQFHGTMAGNAVLDAHYRIAPRSGQGEPIEYRFSKIAALSREGFPGMIEAERHLARELAGAIAASLRELNTP